MIFVGKFSSGMYIPKAIKFHWIEFLFTNFLTAKSISLSGRKKEAKLSSPDSNLLLYLCIFVSPVTESSQLDSNHTMTPWQKALLFQCLSADQDPRYSPGELPFALFSAPVSYESPPHISLAHGSYSNTALIGKKTSPIRQRTPSTRFLAPIPCS
ncbi:hypothetical protein P154DRAFT_361185 [Amniculicola lignicola CBS 123094]|uniref:Uncharacterized protein n=1 Tax=Amniculicola lignicola CBS 123094 TaxID=1392246 RepID=A0A6A5W1V4_9PLEO|nr:hypothetical protein P154DRAFT_361185 [Amniculicola lignicola CBS 123094]